MRKKSKSFFQIDHLELRRLLSATLFVSSSAPGPTHDGSSWANAYTDLQAALSVATSGTTIEVGQGTYKPTTPSGRAATFQLINGVTIQGGYAGFGQSNPDARDITLFPTILSGDIGTTGTVSDNSYHVVTGSGTNSTAILDGFNISDGNADGGGDLSCGAGIFDSFGSPTISNSTVVDNTAAIAGGGIYNYHSLPDISECTITGNTSTDGGGVNNRYSAPTVTDCTISDNSATGTNEGGGIANELHSSPTLTDCTITGNSALNGGGVLNSFYSSPTLTDCIINDNTATNVGAGVYSALHSSPTIIGCEIVGNSTTGSWGGGIEDGNNCTTTITDSLISGNSADGASAIYANGGTVNAINCTISGNTTNQSNESAIYGFSHSSVLLTNCIVWADTSPGGQEINIDGTSSATVTYTDIDQSGYAGSNHNINADPTFIRAVGANGPADLGDLRLQSSSPAIDAGSDTAINGTGVTTDIDGLSRIAGTHVDLGAFESHWAMQSTVFVDASATGSATGGDWHDAYPSLAAALDYAVSGETIEVAQGTYTPSIDGNRFDTFQLVSGVSVEGGFAGQINPNAARNISLYPTILSGDIGTAGNNSDNSYNVVSANNTDSTAALDGFTITAGNADGSGHTDGGGVFDNGGSPTISNCIITGNTASFGGGGVYNIGSSMTLSDSTISGNTAGTSGGGFYDRYSTLSLTGCTITDNSSDSNGGGMLNNQDTTDALTNCIITGNIATFDGGGVANFYSSPTLTNCVIAGNTAGQNGGAINIVGASPTLLNCTISGNSAVHDGGGIYIKNSATPTLTNCILWGDTVASNVDEIGSTPDSSATITFSDVEGGASGFNNNLATDPKFFRDVGTNGASDYGDLHLQPDSPVLDRGSNTAIIGTTVDADGKPRIFNRFVDLGAYEYQILFVDLHATGSNDGSSWANAFTDLQSALVGAADGTTIDVAQGTYYPTSDTDTSATFQLKDGVEIYGGFAGDTTSIPGARDPKLYPTILSGDIGVQGVISDNSNNVVTGSGTDSTAVLDGFTITDGNAKGGSGKQYSGGGIYDNDGSPTINDCIITGNQSSVDSGGGVYNIGGSSPMITNTTISNNSAFSVGGGIDNRNGSPTLINCSITGNTARAAGAGVYDYAAATFIDCLIAGNTTTGINGNSATGNGGGIYTGNTGVLTLINCTVAQNSAPHVGGIYNQSSAAPVITNSILWGDSPNEIVSSHAPNITYSDIDQSGFAGSNHNIDVDPLFANGVSGGKFRLELTSPAVDVGLNSAIAGTNTDLDGSPRITNGTVDLGAYEILPTIFVDANATGANNGSSWTDAFTTLTAALSLASPESGQTIDVAQGTYKPTTTTDRTASFDLVADVSLFGGFAGDTTANPGLRNPSLYPSILSGEIGAPGISDNSYHVVYAKYAFTVSSAKLDGFTITGGNADGDTLGHFDQGGGILIRSCNPTINDCIISGNSASDDGGGIYFDDITTTLTNCVITGNTAGKGGGMASQSASLTLIDSILAGNSAGTGGGIYDSDVTLTLTNCTITGNTATSNGGGLYGAISGETLTNCILWGDTAQTDGNEIDSSTSDSATITFSDIDQSGYAGANNNLDADPQFVRSVDSNGASDFGDLHILGTSPSVNAGSNAAISGTTTDLDGNARIVAGTVDMGAYEAFATHLAIFTQPAATDIAGDDLPVVIRVEDQYGAIFSSDNSTVAIALANSPSGATLGGTSSVAAHSGVATFNGFFLTQAGSYTLSFNNGSLPIVTSNTFIVAPAAASALLFFQPPVSATAGLAIRSGNIEMPAVGIEVVDQYGNIADDTSNITATITNGPTGVVLPTATTVATDDGNAQFSDLVLTIAGEYTLQFSDGLLPVLTTSIDVSAAAAAKLAFITQPANTGAGQNLPSILVAIEDQFGNIVTNDDANGTAGFANDADVTLTSSPGGITETVAAGSGVATFSDFSLTAVGDYTLTATSGSLTSAVSNSFTISTNSAVPIPTSLVISMQPADSIGGQAISPITIEVEDQFGNPVDGTSVTLSIATGPSGSNLGGTRTIATTNGIATFNNLTLGRAGAFTLTASDGSLAAVNTSSFTITYAGPQLVFVTEPTNIVAGAKIPAFRVSPEDINGNPLLTNKSKITIRSSAGKLLGSSTASVKNGVAIFKNLSFQQAGSYTFQVTDSGFGSALSNTITVAPAAATKMAFTPQPSNVVHGTPFNVTVELTDKYGNAVDDGSTVDLVFGSHPKTATSLNLSTTVSDGFADFDNITLDAAGNYTLKASDGKSKATSKKFVVS